MNKLRIPSSFFNGNSCSRGFTLLEVIVALSLVSIAVVIVMQLFSANMRAIATSESYVNASANAEAVMRNLLADEDFPKNAAMSGFLEEYRCESSVVKVNEERTKTINAEIYQVKVTLSWKDGLRDRTITLYTLKTIEKKI